MIIDKIDTLKKEKQLSIEDKLGSQKGISKPLIFREHKQKLTEMVEEKPQVPARKSFKKDI